MTAHIPKMFSTTAHIGTNGVEMDIGNVLLQTELSHHWGNGWVVGVVDAGKQVVLDLVVQTTVGETEPRATHVRGGDYLNI